VNEKMNKRNAVRQDGGNSRLPTGGVELNVVVNPLKQRRSHSVFPERIRHAGLKAKSTE